MLGKIQTCKNIKVLLCGMFQDLGFLTQQISKFLSCLFVCLENNQPTSVVHVNPRTQHIMDIKIIRMVGRRPILKTLGKTSSKVVCIVTTVEN